MIIKMEDKNKELLKKLITALGIINAGFGSVINNNNLIIIGTILGVIGALMIVNLK